MRRLSGLMILLLLAGACDGGKQETGAPKTRKYETTGDSASTVTKPLERSAWFGETHVHSSFSFDAYIYNVRATPDDAYRYAKGEAIFHTSGKDIQSARAIDFMAVTDHAEYLGILPRIANSDNPLSDIPFARELISKDKKRADAAFGKMANSLYKNQPIDELQPPEVVKSNWQAIIDAAERHYEPGKFTTIVGYEWTSIPGHRNLHRNVVFRGGKGQVPALPFSSLDSPKPEALWQFMDGVREQGMAVLAIPHNANLSDGLMFPVEYDSWGKPLGASYADARNRNEPLVEITQIKGTSETHPALSPNDEWADFEIVEGIIGLPDTVGKSQGGYARRAYLDGLILEGGKGFNPYKFGVIGATDSHNASVPSDENNYPGKVGIADDTPQRRRTGVTGGLVSRTYSASGLAGVWAEEHTRESIFDAMARKETFATSGPRIKVRFFGGWHFTGSAMDNADWPTLGYEQGVPMGSDLPVSGSAENIGPAFLVWAQKDPDEASLQRLQIIKGWVENGQSREKVFDIACADDMPPDPETHRCPDNGATVNLSDCSISADKGDIEIASVWRDPEFDADQRAFYYVRVLQNPTCRWSSWDALRNSLPLLEDVPATLQERAWSSPIWYNPT